MAIKPTLDGGGTGANVLGVPDVTEREQIYQGTLALSGNSVSYTHLDVYKRQDSNLRGDSQAYSLPHDVYGAVRENPRQG